MAKKILVTGGAGYIGSFIVRELLNNGFSPYIVDNLSSGHRNAVKDIPLVKIDLAEDVSRLNKLFEEEHFEGVIHMASYIQMGESFVSPGKYFTNNLNSAINLLETMNKYQCKYVVFSSSAGVYGTPDRLPISEESGKNPENPYGESKLMVEKILSWYDKAHDIRSISIRYFNAAGAALNGSIGENHPNESHIIPLLMNAAITGTEFTLFGNDYKTKDKTCVRDYVHVLDLASAHVLSLKALWNGKETTSYNAGVGKGYSNLEIIKEIEKLTGKFKWKFGPRRLGDADALYASTDKISKELGWKPKYGLPEIIQSAYLWHKNNPNGYKK